MEVKQSGGPIIYRSGMNEKIHRNFEIFSPCDFIAAFGPVYSKTGSFRQSDQPHRFEKPAYDRS